MGLGLGPLQYKFVLHYADSGNATKAAILAGYSERTAGSIASQLLDNAKVVEAIEERKAELAATLRVSRDWVLRQWYEIAIANPADLVRVETGSCRSCWPGIDAAGLPANPECKKCKGEGAMVQVLITDTKDLKGPARRLYAGAHQTKDGVKVLMRNQDEALKNIANYLGMTKTELTGPGGGPIQLQAVANTRPLNEWTLEELDAELMRIEQQKLLENSTNGVDLGVGGPVLEGKLLES